MKKNAAVPMRTQSPKERIQNFDEVALGYSAEEAIQEAKRCLQCKHKPCTQGCPVNIAIPEFIKAITEEDFQRSIDIIHETDCLPCMTGRVCPQERQCQSKCVLLKTGSPIEIGRLERFVADLELSQREGKLKRKRHRHSLKVAVVGSGPAGLACAAELSHRGYAVTIYEGFHEPGGVLVYGIPEFRLPKDIVTKEIESLHGMGAIFELNVVVGRAITIEELFKEGFSAVFIGAGAGLPKFMGIPGENLNGVYSANEFLTRVNLMKAYKFPEYDTPVRVGRHVAVIGGGNVAMDSARTARRLGAKEVTIVYRRTEDEMPARREEIEHAKEEGIIFRTLANPLELVGDQDGFVEKLHCQEMTLGEPDVSGRRSPVATHKGFEIDVDQVIMAIGTTPNPILRKTTPQLQFTNKGTIVADETGHTTMPGVFAGGDIVTGAATVVTAMGAGRKAAIAMDEYLQKLK